ncbi:MAG: lipase/acyltransferase domain-containing protein [Stenotrophomonas sp.]
MPGLLLLLGSTLATLLPVKAHALECGSNNGYTCNGTANQFAGGFNPGVGKGGFGGGNCSASRTPVVFIPGNGDSAISFDMPAGAVSGYGTPPRSIYAELKAAGYNDCELFGITYLDASQRAAPQNNYHQHATYQVIKTFIDKVKAYTGKTQVDLVTHSLGSSMGLAMIRYHDYQGSIRRFINIAGGLRGLQTCRSTGYQSPYAPTCNAEAYAYPYNYYTFGLYPSTGVSYYGYNRWTGSGAGSLRTVPASYSSIRFYTITAGLRDQVHCFTVSYAGGCSEGALFNTATNVYAQLDIGAGSSAYGFDWNWSDGSPYNFGGGDTSNGVGHFRSRNNAGIIVRNMLTSDCSSDCAAGYGGVYGPAVNR